MNRYVSSKTVAGALAVLSALLAWPLAAQEEGSGQVGATPVSPEDQYRATLKQVEGLKVYNALMERQIAAQQADLTGIAASIEEVGDTERQILPLLTRMIDGLDAFVKLDLPFRLEERTDRVADLRDMMEQANVGEAEKFRRITEALTIENDYGKTVETYVDTLTIGEGRREVDILKVGRIGLYYQTSDAVHTGMWDQQARQWVALDSGSARNQVQQGLKIAKKQVAPDLLMLPIPGPEAAQ